MEEKKKENGIMRFVIILEVVFCISFAGYGFFWLINSIIPFWNILIRIYYSHLFTACFGLLVGVLIGLYRKDKLNKKELI